MSTPMDFAIGAVDVVGGGHHDEQLHVALIELFGQQRRGAGRFGVRVLEAAGRQALGDGYAEHPERDRQQRRGDR